MDCWEGEQGKLSSLIAGRCVDRVQFKSGLLGGRAGKDIVIDGRKVCRQGEEQEWAAGRENGEDLVIDGRKVCRRGEEQEWAADRESGE